MGGSSWILETINSNTKKDMAMYARVADGVVVEIMPRPDWRHEDGSSVSDALLREHGILPVSEALPAYDGVRERLSRRPSGDWTVAVDGTQVLIAYDCVALTSDELWTRVRAERDRRLTASDKAVMPDRWEAMPPEQRAAWGGYRQGLRDITAQPDPTNIVWPAPPEV